MKAGGKKGKKGNKNATVPGNKKNQEGLAGEEQVNMAEPGIQKKATIIPKKEEQLKEAGRKILERKLTPKMELEEHQDVSPDGVDFEDDPQPKPRKKKGKKFEIDEDLENQGPKTSFFDKFSHLKCSKEKFQDKQFRVSLALIAVGFVLWIFGFVMGGQSNNYIQRAPKLVPVLTVFTGMNTMAQGYYYLLDFDRKMKYMIISMIWLSFHFISLLMVSFITIMYLGNQALIVSSWLLLGITLSAFFTQVIRQIKRRSLFGKYIYLNIWLLFHSFLVVLFSNLAPIKAGPAGVSVFLHLPMIWWVIYVTQSFILSKVAPSDAELQQASQRYLIQEHGDTSVKEMLSPEDLEIAEGDKTYSELIEHRNQLAKKQARNSCFITKKMDPKLQTSDLVDALLRSVKLYGDAFMIDNTALEDQEFLDEYEELWTRFQKLTNQLQISMRPNILQQLQKVSQEETFFYSKCYSNLHIGALGYIQSIALINEERLDEARTCLNTALIAIVTLKTLIGQYRDKLRDNTLILLTQYSKNLEERLKIQQKELHDPYASQQEPSNKGLGAVIENQSKKNQGNRYGNQSHQTPTQGGMVSTRIDSFDNGASLTPNIKPLIQNGSPEIKEEGYEDEEQYGYEVYEVEEGQDGGEGDELIEEDAEVMIQQEMAQMEQLQQQQLEVPRENVNEEDDDGSDLPDIDNLLDSKSKKKDQVEEELQNQASLKIIEENIETPIIIVQPPPPTPPISNHNNIEETEHQQLQQDLLVDPQILKSQSLHEVQKESQPFDENNNLDHDKIIAEELDNQENHQPDIKQEQLNQQNQNDQKKIHIEGNDINGGEDEEDIEFENIEDML